MKPRIVNTAVAVAAAVIACLCMPSCKKDVPDGELIKPKENENGGLTVCELGKGTAYEEGTSELRRAVGVWIPVRETVGGESDFYIRYRCDSYRSSRKASDELTMSLKLITDMYCGNSIRGQFYDIPRENAEELVKFIEWAKEADIQDETVKVSYLIFEPLPGSNFWIRRILPSGEWEIHRNAPEGLADKMEFDIDSCLDALKKAIAESKVLEEADPTE